MCIQFTYIFSRYEQRFDLMCRKGECSALKAALNPRCKSVLMKNYSWHIHRDRKSDVRDTCPFTSKTDESSA